MSPFERTRCALVTRLTFCAARFTRDSLSFDYPFEDRSPSDSEGGRGRGSDSMLYRLRSK